MEGDKDFNYNKQTSQRRLTERVPSNNHMNQLNIHQRNSSRLSNAIASYSQKSSRAAVTSGGKQREFMVKRLSKPKDIINRDAIKKGNYNTTTVSQSMSKT